LIQKLFPAFFGFIFFYSAMFYSFLSGLALRLPVIQWAGFAGATRGLAKRIDRLFGRGYQKNPRDVHPMACIPPGQRGFVLIELAIVLVVLGVLGGVLFSDLQSLSRHRHRQKTLAHQKAIFQALAEHLAHYGCLPQSACDFGPSRGKTGSIVGQPGGPGIVPFRTLGLDEAIAKDGYGRFFTYVVHAPMTTQGLPDKASLCRAALLGRPTLDVLDGAYGSVAGALPIIPLGGQDRRRTEGNQSALGSPLSGSSSSGSLPSGGPFLIGPSVNQSGQGLVLGQADKIHGEKIYSGKIHAANGPLRSEVIAVVLISHGRSGGGAFTGRGGRAPVPAGSSPGKHQNAGAGLVFSARPMPGQAGLHDDHVSYKTASQMLGGAGISCYDVLYPGVCVSDGPGGVSRPAGSGVAGHGPVYPPLSVAPGSKAGPLQDPRSGVPINTFPVPRPHGFGQGPSLPPLFPK
jgi:prepilin-type N-terminal cleavage/methylation domain-containing protein